MKKGRSSYNFKVENSADIINQIILEYLSSNKFELIESHGERYYRSGDVIDGYRYFNYLINGSNLVIYAWLKGAFGEIELEQDGMLGVNDAILSYRASLNDLFERIKNSNSTNDVNNTNISTISEFQNNTLKKQEVACELGFWLSLLGLFVSFFGKSYDAIIFATNICFAVQGLQTRKKKKAKATIILTIISIIIFLISLISNV